MLSPRELASSGLSLFCNASNQCRFDFVAKCPEPMVRMMSILAREIIEDRKLHLFVTE